MFPRVDLLSPSHRPALFVDTPLLGHGHTSTALVLRLRAAYLSAVAGS